MGEAATQEVEVAPLAAARRRARAILLLLLLATGFSVAAWTSLGRDAFVVDRRAFWGQPWRFFAAPLVHEHVLQLVFGAAGVWFFGGELERRLGAGRMLGFVALQALVVGFAEQAFDHGGVGLTSIAFGCWALLVVGGWRSPVLRGAVPVGLSVLMIAAFLLCIVALPVSNWGHAAGMFLGVLAGLCLDARGEFRQAIVPLAVVLLVVLGAGATRWRTSWNRGGASVEYDRAAFAALERGDEPGAEALLRVALSFDERDGTAWWNLGSVLARMDRTEDAADACWHAYENGGLDAEQLAYLEAVQRWALEQHLAQGEAKQAFPFATHVAKLRPDDLDIWESVRELADELDLPDWYDRADHECQRLDPAPR